MLKYLTPAEHHNMLIKLRIYQLSDFVLLSKYKVVSSNIFLFLPLKSAFFMDLLL